MVCTDYSYPKPACSKEEFQKCVENHKPILLKDDGVYRHIKFVSTAESFNQWFELVTYPDHLVFSGDMGTYVFSRIEDMFRFFRKDDLKISPTYWAEKCVSSDVDGIEVFSPEYFTSRINEWMDEAEFSAEAREEAVSEVLGSVCEGEMAAMWAAIEFRATDGTTFSDFWEVDCNVYTYRFLWCCYAVVWGIQEYDKLKVLE